MTADDNIARRIGVFGQPISRRAALLARHEEALLHLYKVLQPKYHGEARRLLLGCDHITIDRYRRAVALGAGWDEIVRYGCDLAEMLHESRVQENLNRLLLRNRRYIYDRRVDIVTKGIIVCLLITSILMAIL